MTQTKTIKFFISSTFKDFEGERNILNKFVFPKLKELCHQNGFGFQPIDLRWGVKEEAGIDQQTMNICLNEIKRSSYEPKPNLLLLVGQRYGWVPLPYEIKEDEFNEVLSKATKYYRKQNHLKLTYDPYEVKILKKWYIKDENSIPTTYYLKDKYEYKNDRSGWSKIENTIRDAFQNSSNNFIYHTSATEQEMYEGLDAFSKEVDHSHTYAYFREIVEYDINDKDLKDYIDIKVNNKEEKLNLKKLNDLKKRLQHDCNIPKENQINGDNKYQVSWNQIEIAKNLTYEDLTLENAPAYLKKFYEDILNKYEKSIQQEIDDFGEQTELEIELEQQKIFLDKKSEVVLGRDTEVENIQNFLASKEDQYYLEYGKSGTGKTSVMAKAICNLFNCQNKKSEQSNNIFYRFIGTTANSTYSRQVFENIYWEIESTIQNDKKLSIPVFEYEDDKFKKQFNDKLKEYQELIKKPIIIFLDAVDQFEDQNNLTILLEKLPINIKVVFSCLYDETKPENEDYYWYYKRLNHLENENSKLKPLSDKSRSNKEILIAILDRWLENINRQITTDQKKHLIDNVFTKDSTPLFARLVYEIVKYWKHDEKDLELKKDEKGLIYQFFDFIVKNYHHETQLLQETMGYITASKDGLSEEELISLFSRDEKLLSIFQNHRYQTLDKLPNAIWSRFYYYINDIFTEKLIDGEMLISPYHRIIEEAIKEKYHKEKYHGKLSNYFYTLQDKTKTWDVRYYNLHMLSELPFQLFKSKDSTRLKEILFDLEFAGTIYNNSKQKSFRDIMSKASNLEKITEDEIYPWESFYREKEHLITKVDEKSWKHHQSLFQLAYEDGLNSPLHKKAIQLKGELKEKIGFLDLLLRKNIPGEFQRNNTAKNYLNSREFFQGVENDFNVKIDNSYNNILSYFNWNSEIKNYMQKIGAENIEFHEGIYQFKLKESQNLKITDDYFTYICMVDYLNKNKIKLTYSNYEFYINSNEVKFTRDYFYYLENKKFIIMEYTGQKAFECDISFIDDIDFYYVVNNHSILISNDVDDGVYIYIKDFNQSQFTKFFFKGLYNAHYKGIHKNFILFSTNDYSLYSYNINTKQFYISDPEVGYLEQVKTISNKYLAILDESQKITIFDFEELIKNEKNSIHSIKIEDILLTEDYIVSCSNAIEVIIWNIKGKIVHTINIDCRSLDNELYPISEDVILLVTDNYFYYINIKYGNYEKIDTDYINKYQRIYVSIKGLDNITDTANFPISRRNKTYVKLRINSTYNIYIPNYNKVDNLIRNHYPQRHIKFENKYYLLDTVENGLLYLNNIIVVRDTKKLKLLNRYLYCSENSKKSLLDKYHCTNILFSRVDLLYDLLREKNEYLDDNIIQVVCALSCEVEPINLNEWLFVEYKKYYLDEIPF